MVVRWFKGAAALAVADIVSAYLPGGRVLVGACSETRAIHLWEQLPYDYARCHSFSDKWEAYRHVFDHKRHRLANKEEGETNHVERRFNTLRQRLGRFTRKTLSFSKRDDMPEGVLRLFLYQYNLTCIS